MSVKVWIARPVKIFALASLYLHTYLSLNWYCGLNTENRRKWKKYRYATVYFSSIYCHSSFIFLVARLGQNNIRCEMETTARVPLHFHRWHSSRGAAGIRSRRSLTLKETAMESCATGNKFARSVNKQRSSRSRPPGATTAVVGKHPVSVQFEPRALFGYTRYKVDQVKRGYESSVDIKKYSFGLTAGRVHHLLNSCHIFSSGGVRETASGPTEEETSDLLKECQH